MKRTTPRTLAALLAVLASTTTFAANESVVKPLKAVIGSVRYAKDKQALKQFAADAQGRMLLEDAWEKGTAAQRKEFTALFQTLFAKIAFPKLRENFEHLSTVLYEEPKVDGKKAEVASTIVIDHPLKKQELKLRYKLEQDGAAWKVVDVSVLGDSMLQGIREDQIRPIMKDGGWDLLLETMRKKAKEVEHVKIK